jgi:ATP-dependent RNA helicase DDX5/DBP2
MMATTNEFDFYQEHPDVSAMTEEDANSWRDSLRIRVTDGKPPKPVRTFLEAAFPEFLTVELEAAGFPKPTPIQSQSWPIALSGRDMIGLAATGSGKTLCFVLPAMVHVVAQPELQAGDGPIALMLAPTRELALQIKGECDRFGSASALRSTCVYGGVPKGPQQRDLLQGVDMAIATPGRLQDFMDGGITNLKRTTYLVLDEADRMLDLGFEKQLRGIVAACPPERQTMMWSASWPREVQSLAEALLRQPLMVQVGAAQWWLRWYS